MRDDRSISRRYALRSAFDDGRDGVVVGWEMMLTLRELFKLTYDIAEVCITARTPDDGHYLHEWIFGEHIYETGHMYHERIEGKLTIRNEKIQHHGEPARGGAEIGWGVKDKLFPKELLYAPITHLSMVPMSQGRGTKVRVDVEMQELTAMMLVKSEEKE